MRAFVLAATDAFLIAGGFLLASLVSLHMDLRRQALLADSALKIGIALAAILTCMFYYDLYESRVLSNPREVATRLTQVLGTACVVLAVVYTVYPRVRLAAGMMLLAVVVVGTLLVGWRSAFLVLNRSPRFARRAILIGYGALATSLAAEIKKHPELGLRVVGYVGDPPTPYGGQNGIRRVGGMEHLFDIFEREKADHAIITLSNRRGQLPLETLLRLKSGGVKVEDGADVYETVTGKVHLDSLRLGWLVLSPGFQVSKKILLYKRAFSIFVAGLLVLLSWPLMLLLALIIRLDSAGPVIFRQKRVGKDGKIFTLYKFRTMRENADHGGVPLPATRNDPRVTRVGRWLRKTRLDELPQLYNVLRGDIYFVGPRPFALEQEQELVQKIPFYRCRWTVRPGATGWAQIYRPYCTTLQDNAEKLAYDLFYIKNMSAWLDLLIFFHTVKILLLGRGAR